MAGSSSQLGRTGASSQFWIQASSVLNDLFMHCYGTYLLPVTNA